MAGTGGDETRIVGVYLVDPGESFPYTLRGTEVTVELRRLNDSIRAKLRAECTTVPNPLGSHLPLQLDEVAYDAAVLNHCIVSWNPKQWINRATGEEMPCTIKAKQMLPDSTIKELLGALRDDGANYIYSPVSAADQELEAESSATSPVPFGSASSTG